MGSTRTAWHVLLAALLRQHAPRPTEVRTEVPLSAEPLRADYLLIAAGAGPRGAAGTLRGLWDRLARHALIELKSTGRPYRSRNLDRFFSYLHLYFAEEIKLLQSRADLCGVLLVPARTPSLDADAKALGLIWKDLGDGYWRLDAAAFALYVAEIRVVARAESDDLLSLFGDGEAVTVGARRWLAEQLGAEEIAMEIHESEGYEEVVQKLVATLPPEQVLAAFKPEQVLAAFKPEQRMAGLPPEQRVAGLTSEQLLLALPDEVLRGLSDAYLDTLPAPTRAAIRSRIGK